MKQSEELSPRAVEVLQELAACSDLTGLTWATPMMVGGRDASHHSATLGQLVRCGLAERRRRNTLANAIGSRRGSWEYRITSRGKRRLRSKP